MATCIWLLVMVVHANAVLEAPKEPITQEMKAYFMMASINLRADYDVVGIINTNEEYTAPIADFVLKYKNTDPVLIGNRNGYYNKHVHVGEMQNLFCFVNTVNDFESVLQYVRINPFFDLSGYIQFVLAESVNDTVWLHSTLELIWYNHILNFVVVFQINTTVEVFGYNKFSNTYYNFTSNKTGSEFFPDKLDDLFGTELIVGMIIDPPRNYYSFGDFLGEDATRLYDFGRSINASIRIHYHRSFFGVSKAIRNREDNFSMTQYFSYPNNDLVIEYGYPLQMEYMCIAVPTPDLKPSFLYLFLVFDSALWTSLILSIVLVMLMHILYSNIWGECDIGLIFLAALQIFLNTSYIYISRGKWSLKILLISYAFFSLVISAAFNSELRESLLTPKYDKQIKTIEDLYASGLKIALNTSILANFTSLSEFEPERFEHINVTNLIVDRMARYKRDMAYILPLSYLELLVTKKDSAGNYYYRIMDERLMAGHSVYNFAKHSPFTKKVEEYVEQERQYGLSLFGNTASITSIEEEEEESTPLIQLTIHHMESAFLILCNGYLLGVLVFLIEIIKQRYYKKDVPFMW